MRIKINIILLALLAAFSQLEASRAYGLSPEESIYQEAREGYYKLKESAKVRKYRHNWIGVIKDYEKVDKKYPGSKYGDDALYMAAQLHAELFAYSSLKKDLISSNDFIDKLIEGYPSSSLSDDAMMMMGKNYENLGDNENALIAYTRVLEKYKNGDMVDRARKKISTLKAPTVKAESSVKVKKKPVNENNNSISDSKSDYPKGMSVVEDLRHWSNPNYTRIVIGLDKTARYKEHMLRPDPSIKKPARLYVDIFGARKSADMKESVPIHDGLLKKARAGQYTGDTVRVVLDIESIKDYKIFPMLEPFRIIIDVRGDSKIKSPSIESLLPAEKTKNEGLKSTVEEESMSLSRQLGLGIRKIVIDAGHGGKDPGATGRNGTKEKSITLKIAKSLKYKLEKKFGYQVLLTRKNDRYLRLEERTAIANMENADLFISIHANANRNRKAYGIETYFMNARASDRFAAEVAARENAVTSNKMGEFGSVLEQILVDMQKTNKINESNKLASSIQGNLHKYMTKRYNSIKNLGVKRGPFYVLIGANMPSILVEVGFVSNSREEKRLNNNKYIDHISNAIALGIEKYSDHIKTASVR